MRLGVPEDARLLLLAIAKRVIWWGDPKEWLDDAIRFAAQVMTMGIGTTHPRSGEFWATTRCEKSWRLLAGRVRYQVLDLLARSIGAAGSTAPGKENSRSLRLIQTSYRDFLEPVSASTSAMSLSRPVERLFFSNCGSAIKLIFWPPSSVSIRLK